MTRPLCISIFIHSILIFLFFSLESNQRNSWTVNFSKKGGEINTQTPSHKPLENSGLDTIQVHIQPIPKDRIINQALNSSLPKSLSKSHQQTSFSKKMIYDSDIVNEINESIQNTIRYPSIAKRMGWEGTTLIDVSIYEKKQEQKITAKLTRSSGYPILDQTALEAVYLWKFNQQLPEIDFILEFTFSLE